jgi:hypothetical protein
LTYFFAVILLAVTLAIHVINYALRRSTATNKTQWLRINLAVWSNVLLGLGVIIVICMTIQFYNIQTHNQEQSAEIVQLQARHVKDDQKAKISTLLKSASKPKEPIVLNLPLSATGEATEFNNEIKSVLTAGGWETKDVWPIQDETLLGFTGSGVYLQVKDQKHPPQAAITLFKAFHSANIRLIPYSSPEFTDPERVVIIVGSHP